MTTTTYYSAATASTTPTPYLANVIRAVQALLKALFPVHTVSPVERIRDRMEILRMARECRNTAPSLSQELNAIACRDL